MEGGDGLCFRYVVFNILTVPLGSSFFLSTSEKLWIMLVLIVILRCSSEPVYCVMVKTVHRSGHLEACMSGARYKLGQ